MPPYVPQDQPAESASLPPVMPQAQAGMPAMPAAPTQLMPQQSAAMPAGQQVLLQAKLAIEQYKNDPYRLALALEQLKSAYLAQEFNVVVNPAEK